MPVFALYWSWFMKTALLYNCIIYFVHPRIDVSKTKKILKNTHLSYFKTSKFYTFLFNKTLKFVTPKISNATS